MIKGYKAFNKDMENRYGKKFVEGETYSIEGPIEFGNNGNGFHFCKRLEDTLRYVSAMEEEVKIAEITGFGELVERTDEYYDYYEMYVTRTIRIDKILSRQEILEMFFDNIPDRVIRFVSSYKLTPEEIEIFKLKYYNEKRIIKALQYYQEDNKEVYNIKEKLKVKKK